MRGRATTRSQLLMATRRPWRELIGHPSTSYTRPHTLTEFTTRLKKNLNYFRVNYAMIILLILFLSLLWHPISMLVFLILFSLWFFLYFFRDEPIVLLNWTIDDRIVLVLLSVVTVISLIFTSVWLNVLVSVCIGVGLVLLHAGFRVTEDLFVEIDDDEEDGAGGLLSFAGST